jgi:hypothetical protein
VFYQMPPYELVDRLLEVDDAAGGLRWRTGYGNAKAGDFAGAGIKTGYRRIMLEGKTYAVGRLVWFLRTKTDPGQSVVRHLDGDLMNDRMSNLELRPMKKNNFQGELPPGDPRSILKVSGE